MVHEASGESAANRGTGFGFQSGAGSKETGMTQTVPGAPTLPSLVTAVRPGAGEVPAVEVPLVEPAAGDGFRDADSCCSPHPTRAAPASAAATAPRATYRFKIPPLICIVRPINLVIRGFDHRMTPRTPP
ncbi:hypothetical protein GCM10022284_35690 [Streptomyces hundungensis]